MTFWAKFLVVTILVLSLVFAAFSTALFAKKQDYRNLLESQKLEFTTRMNALQTENATLKSTKEKLANDIVNLNTEISSLQNQKKQLSDNIETLKTDISARETQLMAAQDTIKEQAIAVKGVADRNDALLKENMAVRGENITLTKKLADEQNKTNDLQTQLAALKTEREDLQAKLADANDKLKNDEDIFTELARRNIDVQPIISGLKAVPKIDGLVAEVNAKENLVILNVGSKQGVRNNFDFTIYRDGNFVATVTVFDTRDGQCAARILRSKLPIKQGDKATTRLQS